MVKPRNLTRASRRSHFRAIPLLTVLLLVLASLVPYVSLAQSIGDSPPVKNFIYIIGDGTSFAQLESARIAKQDSFIMDTMPVQHQAATRSLDAAVTDSAAAATALSSGHLTNNRMIGMLPDGTHTTSILELAQQAGKATGVVVTDVLHGATPGAFIAHAPDRGDTEIIMEWAVYKTQPDVLLGGGMNALNLIGGRDRLATTDYTFVTSRDELLAHDVRLPGKLLGIFAPTTMTYEVDRTPSEPHIAEMVAVALDILSEAENGFFLMIEGSRIDHANHANDLRRSVHEVWAFDEAIGVALAFAAEHGDTTVIVTADHETGGLTPGKLTPSPQVILNGVDTVTKQIVDAYRADPHTSLGALFERYAGVTDLQSRAHQGNFSALVKEMLEDRAYYHTTTGHTATPVPIKAYGPYAELFGQVNHTSDIGRTAIEVLGVATGGNQ